MYSLSIHFGPNAMVWQFLFKEKEHAETAFKAAAELIEPPSSISALVQIIDDYGQRASFSKKSITGVLFEDLDLLEEARIQRTLSNARGQAKYAERVKADPMLMRAMAQQRNGPAIHTPFNQN